MSRLPDMDSIQGPACAGRYRSTEGAKLDRIGAALGGVAVSSGLAEYFQAWDWRAALGRITAIKSTRPRPATAPPMAVRVRPVHAPRSRVARRVAQLAAAGWSIDAVVQAVGADRHLVRRYWPAEVAPKGFTRRRPRGGA